MKLSLGLSPRDYSVAGGGVVYDADAQAYFTANTAITNSADKTAINTFYLGLKTDGIYTKIKAMYLPIWSSASSNKWNLVNPLDTDAAYRLNFSTGWTHASSGITPDGISAYAETFFSTDKLNLNSIHGSHYSRTNVQSSGTSIGSRKSTTTASAFSLVLRSTTTGGTYRINDATATTFSLGNSDSRGFFIISRNASNSKRLFKNGTQLNSTTTASTGNNNLNIYIAALNQDGSPTLYDNHECAFSSLGDGLDTTETTALYNRVNTLMNYFGINV